MEGQPHGGVVATRSVDRIDQFGTGKNLSRTGRGRLSDSGRSRRRTYGRRDGCRHPAQEGHHADDGDEAQMCPFVEVLQRHGGVLLVVEPSLLEQRSSRPFLGKPDYDTALTVLCQYLLWLDIESSDRKR